MSRVILSLCLCVVFACVNAELIKGVIDNKPVFTKKAVLLEDEVDTNELRVPPEVDSANVFANERCAQIGEFCTYHSDCCTNACLGYMKKCVSGSG
ncbi:unnamed protein product [Leptosia nina]|uniref:Uncharacterized protein n=1 Tax=Leptosia nina TaxID=320188 RepID=A0AAV1J617_9NEOP